jgi:PAS domain S-box-containing protein
MSRATIQAAEHLPAPRPTAWIFPVLVLLASLASTFFLWRVSSREIQQIAETQLNNYAKEITGQILKRLQDNENILRGGNALFNVRGDGLTRQEWQRYASAWKFDISNPGILGFGFSAWLTQAEMSAHLKAIRAEGFPEYTISPAGERSFYTSIIWLEPFNDMNRRAFGYDMYAEPIRQTAMNRARDTGETSISDKVVLVQEGEQDIQNGILMYLPSYRRDMPVETVDQRRAALRGFVYSPIRMHDFVHAALANMPEQIDIAIYSGQEIAPEHLLFRSQPARQHSLSAGLPPAFFTSRTIKAYGLTWNLTFTGLSSFEQQFNPSKSLVILVIGSLASLLLSLLALMQTRSRRQALVIARQAANELLSQQKFALHIEQTPLAVIEWNEQLRVTVWNRAAEHIFGYTADEVLGAHLSFLFAAGEQEAISSKLRAILWQKQKESGTYTNITKDGKAIVCEWYSATLVDQSGDVLGAVTLAHDVTVARDAEQRLRAERNLLHIVMNGTQNAHLVYFDRDFNFINVNQSYARTCGYRPEEMIGKNHFALYPNEENEAIFKRVRDTGEPFEVYDKPFEFSDQPDRGVTWWDWTLTPVKDQAGEVVGLVFSLIETTARKKAELALQASEAQFRLLFERHSAIMLLIDPVTGHILNANEAAAEFYGYSRATLRQMNISEINTRSRDEILIILKEIQGAKRKHFVTSHRLADGSIRNIEVYTAAISIDQQQLNFAIIHDITERLQAEADRDRLETQNRQLQKTESLNRMAGAIAHHFNNQLQAVMISLELIDNMAIEHTHPAEIRSIVNSAIEAAKKAAEVSTLLLTYLAKIPVSFEPLDLADACRKAQAIWLASKPDNVDFRVDLPEDGPFINSNASKIQQLITNLVVNAWEACQFGRGTVTLTIIAIEKEAIVTASRYPVDFQPIDRQYACIEITDTGCGIPQEMFDQLFDPFYTTKFTGRGMGLPVVLGIVRAHQGAIAVASQVGRGSIFRVYLPITEKVIAKKAVPVATDNHPFGHCTVLVVEDVLLIREILAAMLKSLGCTVLQAEDGVQAVELFDRHQKDIACVISDIVMPRMDGWETLKILRQRSPGIPVIFASGYTETQLMEESHDEMPDYYLEKPFRFAKLRVALSNILAKKAAGRSD